MTQFSFVAIANYGRENARPAGVHSDAAALASVLAEVFGANEAETLQNLEALTVADSPLLFGPETERFAPTAIFLVMNH